MLIGHKAQVSQQQGYDGTSYDASAPPGNDLTPPPAPPKTATPDISAQLIAGGYTPEQAAATMANPATLQSIMTGPGGTLAEHGWQQGTGYTDPEGTFRRELDPSSGMYNGGWTNSGHEMLNYQGGRVVGSRYPGVASQGNPGGMFGNQGGSENAPWAHGGYT